MTPDELRIRARQMVASKVFTALTLDHSDRRTQSVYGHCRHGERALLWEEVDVPQVEYLNAPHLSGSDGYHPERGPWTRIKGVTSRVESVHDIMFTSTTTLTLAERCVVCGQAGDGERERASFLGDCRSMGR